MLVIVTYFDGMASLFLTVLRTPARAEAHSARILCVH